MVSQIKIGGFSVQYLVSDYRSRMESGDHGQFDKVILETSV